MKNIKKLWASLWIILVAFLSLYPFKSSGLGVQGMDKLVHLSLYAIMFILIYNWKPREILGNLIFCGLYGFGMELAQHYFIPGRYFEFWDLIANISGSLIGFVISILIITKP
jgi:VanZ family protein